MGNCENQEKPAGIVPTGAIDMAIGTRDGKRLTTPVKKVPETSRLGLALWPFSLSECSGRPGIP
jgi:hypothetical protein